MTVSLCFSKMIYRYNYLLDCVMYNLCFSNIKSNFQKITHIKCYVDHLFYTELFLPLINTDFNKDQNHFHFIFIRVKTLTSTCIRSHRFLTKSVVNFFVSITEYSRTLLYRHLLNTVTSLLRTVCFVCGENPYIIFL